MLRADSLAIEKCAVIGVQIAHEQHAGMVETDGCVKVTNAKVSIQLDVGQFRSANDQNDRQLAWTYMLRERKDSGLTIEYLLILGALCVGPFRFGKHALRRCKRQRKSLSHSDVTLIDDLIISIWVHTSHASEIEFLQPIRA